MHVIQLALFIAFLKKNEKSGVQFSLIQVKVESKNNHTIFTLFFQGTLHTPRSGEAKPSCHEEGNFLTFPPQKAPVSSSAGPSHVAHKLVCVCREHGRPGAGSGLSDLPAGLPRPRWTDWSRWVGALHPAGCSLPSLLFCVFST